MGQEAELVRAYLELMQMRMPDRLSFTVDVQEPALAARCPAATLLTLVENAIRHGIDPSEDGGHIDVRVVASDGRVHAEVADTGVGLKSESKSLGTGITSLRERLQLAFGGDAQLQVAPLQPRGTIATVDFPLRAKPA
jgi:LytS/YehU family sensor histidine kinase